MEKNDDKVLKRNNNLLVIYAIFMPETLTK